MRQDWYPRGADTTDRLDEIHRALAHRRRRFIVYELWQSDPLSLRELADRLLGWDRFSADRRDRLSLTASLKRTHLPVLERADVVDYDPRTGLVRLAPIGKTAEEIRRIAITQAQK